MRDEGLLSIDVHAISHDVLMVYEPDTPYDVKEILAYVHDMCDGRCNRVLIFEGQTLVHDMQNMDHAGWVSVAQQRTNGL